MRTNSLFLAMLLLSASSCMRLDSAMFNNTTLASYTLSDSVIPQSFREQVTLFSSGGAKIYGYYIQSNGRHPETTILYCHGNKDHLQYYWDRAELLYKTGCNVFIFDYQGFGMSEGVATEQNLYADGRAALSYVLAKDTSVHSICYYGFSLGGAVAIELAAHVLAPNALITESAYASADALVKSGTVIDVPHEYILDGSYDNESKVKSIHVPYLLFHGTDDKFIDLAKNGQVLFDNANEPKQLIKVAGADHSEVPMKFGYDAYVTTVEDWFTK
jgi:fermentation-respiration switch protein FrsA (DUF1100 family)